MTLLFFLKKYNAIDGTNFFLNQTHLNFAINTYNNLHKYSIRNRRIKIVVGHGLKNTDRIIRTKFTTKQYANDVILNLTIFIKT